MESQMQNTKPTATTSQSKFKSAIEEATLHVRFLLNNLPLFVGCCIFLLGLIANFKLLPQIIGAPLIINLHSAIIGPLLYINLSGIISFLAFRYAFRNSHDSLFRNVVPLVPYLVNCWYLNWMIAKLAWIFITSLVVLIIS